MTTKPITLLLVEDDPLDVMSLKRGMKKHGVSNELVVAGNGREALDVLRGENDQTKITSPYIILLDINMPVMNGLEFLEAIRKDETLHTSIVFVLTSSDQSADIASAYKKHIAGYILKQNLGDACINIFDMLKTYWRIVELPAE